jgi:hypothetical protein
MSLEIEDWNNGCELGAVVDFAIIQMRSENQRKNTICNHTNAQISIKHLTQTNKHQANTNNNNHQTQSRSTIQLCNNNQQSAMCCV